MFEINELLAKDHHKEISLLDHSKMVLNLGLFLASKLMDGNDTITDEFVEEFKKELSIALACHDIGKCSHEYQLLFKKNKKAFNDEEIKIKHNILSLAFLSKYVNGFYKKTYYPLLTSVLSHHTIDEHVKDYTNNELFIGREGEIECMSYFYNRMKEYITVTHDITFDNNFDIIDNECEKYVRDYKLYDLSNKLDDIYSKKMNDKCLLFNAILVRADRMVSSERYDNNKFLDNDVEYMLSTINSLDVCSRIVDVDIDTCGYDDIERLNLQKHIVNDLLESSNVNLVGASAGFGKTLTGLMWFLKERKKMIWVAPRNVIVNSTYESVVEELVKLKQPNVRVACYQGGMFTKCNYDKNLSEDENLPDIDILVTNIDSFLNSNIKNNMRIHLYSLYSSNVIFDEYHEFFTSEPLFPAFMRTMVTRAYSTNSKTLLLSATPLSMNFIIGKYDNKISEHKLDEIPIHNGDMEVHVKVHNIDNICDIEIPSNDCFVITNTVGQAQSLYKHCNNDEITLIHSLFTDERRSEIENELYNKHGKNSVVSERNVVIGTNIIGVGLNISAKTICEVVSTPENTIQRICGRGGRFNEEEYNGSIEYHVYLLNEDKTNDSFINHTYNLDLYKAWCDKLSGLDGKTITKKDLYTIYEDFKEEHKIEMGKHYSSCFNEGSKQLGGLEVYKVQNNKKDKSFEAHSKNKGYRGNNDSLFVITRYNDGRWCKPLTITSHHLKHETNEHVYERMGIVSGGVVSGTNYPNKHVLNRVYNIKSNGDYTVEKLSKIANRSDRPLPLFDFEYDDKFGLFKI